MSADGAIWLLPPPAVDAAEATPPRKAQVLRFRGLTKLDLEPESVLAGAAEAQLSCVVVLGYDAAGAEYFASSMADGADVLWLMERLKRQLLATCDRHDERGV